MKLSANFVRWALGLVLLLATLDCALALPWAAYDVDGSLIKGAHFKLWSLPRHQLR